MIELIVLTSLSVFGVHTVADNLAFTFKGNDLDTLYQIWGEPKWMKPIIFCPICMASVWGGIFYLVWSAVLIIDPVEAAMGLIPSLFAVAACNYIITRI